MEWGSVAGIARWWIRINRGAKVTIGVVREGVGETFLNKTSKGWGIYQSNGNSGHAGPAKTQYATPLQVGDIVCVEMHLANGPLPGSLRFVVHSAAGEGVDHGVAFSNMHRVGEQVTARTKFHGAASLYNKGDSVTLLRQESATAPGDGAKLVPQLLAQEAGECSLFTVTFTRILLTVDSLPLTS